MNEPSTMFATCHAGGKTSKRLASAELICQVGGMNQRRFTAAGGIFLFLGPIAGALIGIGRGEPILGMLYGFGVGAALALVVWAIDRRKG